MVMKTVLIGINAKYIHTNLAIRLLKANCTFEVDVMEFTIKDDDQTILDAISSGDYAIVGLSCSIWNIEKIKNLLTKLNQHPHKPILILGGPEVSYNPQDYIRDYNVDYVVCGEGEIAFQQLMHALIHHTSVDHIPNLVSKTVHQPIQTIDHLNQLASPHNIPNDDVNRITYVETSRGCPYHCSYCLASLEKKVRFFDINRVKSELLMLIFRGCKTFKFLDRTFNIYDDRAIELFDFLIEHHRMPMSFQFEITGDHLSQKVIDFLHQHAPKQLFRFEIGIQSTNEVTNRLVYRQQDNARLFNIIEQIQQAGIIDLHLDLIAGLPQESRSSFEKTFNDVMRLYPLELQLGFLKLLKGTQLEQEASLYHYVFDSKAPYEIIENHVLSQEDIASIHVVEAILEKYYNTHFMPTAMRFLLEHSTSPFALFLAFGTYYESHFSWFDYNLDDLFKRLAAYLMDSQHPHIEDILFLMKYDYLNYYKIKPKCWWQRTSKQETRSRLQILHTNQLSSYSLEDLYQHAWVEVHHNQVLVAIYMHQHQHVCIYPM